MKEGREEGRERRAETELCFATFAKNSGLHKSGLLESLMG